ncbi:MAG: type II toxin-antitoxin system RelE/ParE family toxin [Dehalococcoidia bacterium]|nr:type II toxin-antitoxin system RelE/ParE family toxin [Dehalococcoidia bacterium]
MNDNYSVTVLRPARKQLERLHPKIRRQIYARLNGLHQDPRPHDIKALRGVGGYRIDSGEYRIIYEIDDRARFVTVRAIKHRKDAYRNL